MQSIIASTVSTCIEILIKILAKETIQNTFEAKRQENLGSSNQDEKFPMDMSNIMTAIALLEIQMSL